MREYLTRVRHHDGEYHATIREISPAREPGTLALTGPEGHGVAETEPAAMLAAIVDARLPDHRPDRRASRYAC
jgi:hypothetical protein